MTIDETNSISEKDFFIKAGQVLRLDPLLGKLYWRKAHQKDLIDQEAGNRKNDIREVRISINGKVKAISSHRIIWYMLYDIVPSKIIHKNGIRTDNRPENLIHKFAKTRRAKRRSYQLRRSKITFIVRGKDAWLLEDLKDHVKFKNAMGEASNISSELWVTIVPLLKQALFGDLDEIRKFNPDF